MSLEIYDCTLREGEQAAGASFTLESRIELVKKLDEFGVDFIEVGWPVVSEDIIEAIKQGKKSAKKSKIVAFGSTSLVENPEQDKNLDSIKKSGADYACIFGKTDLEHVEKQLRINAEENLIRISKSIEFLRQTGVHVFYDAEHFFDGFKKDRDYAIRTLEVAVNAGAEKIILCDTNGGVLPEEARKIVEETKKQLTERKLGPELGVHFHDDCGLALANTLTCLPYITQVQGTINGAGERVGNLDLSKFIPVYIKKLGGKLNVELKELKRISEEAFRLSGMDPPESRAFVGETAFAHKGGVHIDATNKGASYEHMAPEDVGNKRLTLLNTLGGRSSVICAASEFGYVLDKNDSATKEKIDRLFEELEKKERRGYRTGAIRAEQFLLIEKYFGKLDDFFEIERWKVETEREGSAEKSRFYARCKINGNSFEGSIELEGGPVDVAYKTISSLLEKEYPKIKKLNLLDFHVGIARSMREESTVRTAIRFDDGETFETVGVDSNIIQSAIEALTKGFRYYLNRIRKSI